MSFVEKATLQLVDKSSANINKINRSLLGLEKTSKRLQKNLQSTFKINVKGADVATKQVNALTRGLTRLSSVTATPRVSTRGITSATRALVNLRAQASKPINQQLNVIRNGGRGRYAGGGTITALDSFLPRLATTIETAVMNGFKKGLTQQDVADTKLSLVNASPEAKAASRVAALDIVKRNPGITVGTATGFMAENLALTKGDAAAAKALSDMQADLVRFSIALGQGADAATESAFKFSKAADSASLLTDENGNFDPKSAKEFADVVKRARAQFGQEITADAVAQAVKYARQSRFSLAGNDTGFLTLLNVVEESGTDAAVGMNQLIKSLAGLNNNKTVLANLAEGGLITTREVKSGTNGGRKTTTTVVDKSVDPKMLWNDPRGFVEKYLLPLAAKQNVNLNNPDEAATFAAKFAGDRTAIAALINLLVKNQDIKRAVESAQQIDVSPEAMARIYDNSSLLAVNEALVQMTSLAGQLAQTLEGPLITALKAVRDVAGGLAAFVAGEDGTGSAANAAGVVAGGLAAGGLLYKGGKGLLGMLNPFSVPAAQLSGAATQLNIAAAQLQGAALAQGGVPVPGQKGKQPSGTKLNTIGFTPLTFALAAIASLPKASTDSNNFENRSKEWRDEQAKMAKEMKPMSWSEFFWGAGAEEGGFKKTMGIPIKAAADEASASFKETFQTGADQIKTAGQEFGPAASIGIIAAAGPFGDIVAQRIAAATQNIEVTAKAPAAASTATPRAVNTGPIGAAGG